MTLQEQFAVCHIYDELLINAVTKLSGSEGLLKVIAESRDRKAEFYTRWQASGLDLHEFVRREKSNPTKS